MKAAMFFKYGSPEEIKIKEIDKPATKDGEVLIQIKAASVNAYDWHLIKAAPFFTRALSGLFKPKNNIPGADIAGIVIAAGNNVSKFKPGDEVYGCLEGCGKGGLAAGGFLTFEEAAGLPMASVTALQAIRDCAKARQGQSVLINGASGGVGMFAAQIAKAYGAEVTGVCSTGSVEMVRSLGADYVIDYQTETVITDKQYDAIIDVAATLSVKQYRKALKPNGVCVVIGFSTMGHMLSYNFAGKKNGKRIMLCSAKNKNGDELLEINKLIADGKLRVLIDSRYSLDETADAIRRAETGHPKGKVIIFMEKL